MADQRRSGKTAPIISTSEIITNIHALDSKISILAQRIKVLEDNQKILSQTLVKLKKKGISIDNLTSEVGQLRMSIQDLNPSKIVTFDNLHKLVDERIKQLIKT